jgi:hypothetical protein
MLDTLPVEWLLDQHVPLLFFILALLTEPATWSKAVLAAVRRRLGDNDNTT